MKSKNITLRNVKITKPIIMVTSRVKPKTDPPITFKVDITMTNIIGAATRRAVYKSA
jgi:hypothetical protein